MKINDILFEFAPPGSGDGDDGFSEETLKRLAAQWYNGDEDSRVERTLMAAGWEIGQDEGYDDEPGVFVVQSGDVNGNSYISWPAHELKQGVAEGSGNIGAQIKAVYKKIYDAGDDAVEFAYYDSPIFAQYWDEYEGDLDSIIAEVDPSELQIILDELTSAVEDQGLAEGWKEEAEDMGDWAEYVRTKLLKTPQQQRWSVAKQLSQIEVKNFGSELVQRQNYDPKTGKPIASEQLFTQIVQDTLKALNVKPVTGGVALDAEPSEMHKPDDRDGRDWVVSTKMGWLVVPNAGKAPARVKRMLWKAFLAGPEIYPMALEIFEETGDFTEQDYKDCIVKAAEIRNGSSLAVQAYQSMAEARKANTKTARKEFGKRIKAKASDKEQETKQSESDRLWAMLQQHIADAEKNKEVKEANSFFKPGPATTGKFPEPRKPSFPGDQGSKSETLGKDGLIYHWQDPRAKQGVAEGKPEKPEQPEADYGPEYQDMVARVKKLAGMGPLKTVYDPQKRVYKNVPTAVQPKKEQK